LPGATAKTKYGVIIAEAINIIETKNIITLFFIEIN